MLSSLTPCAKASCVIGSQLIGYAQEIVTDSLYEINLTEGTISNLGILYSPFTDPQFPLLVSSLAMISQGLYASDGQYLYSIELPTTVTTIGLFGAEIIELVALENDVLYGVGPHGAYTINTNTGAATLLESFPGGSEMATFAAATEVNGETLMFLVPQIWEEEFTTFNYGTGTWSAIGPQTVNPDAITGAAIGCNGVLYGVTNAGRIGTIAVANGQLTTVITAGLIEWGSYAMYPGGVIFKHG